MNEEQAIGKLLKIVTEYLEYNKENFDDAVDLVSSPGEFHPQALSEPDLRLSPHPAPIIQPRKALF
jgi:hypothetical protein